VAFGLPGLFLAWALGLPAVVGALAFGYLMRVAARKAAAGHMSQPPATPESKSRCSGSGQLEVPDDQ
jgi:hypothetical protein